MTLTSKNSPIVIPTAQTVSFVRSKVRSGGAILEVGCGSGHVAAELAASGYKVTGVDSDKDAVLRARQLDVIAVNASWPNIEIGRMDAVVFTRSLHHISPLPGAVGKAIEILGPEGIVLVEDFAFDNVDQAAITWFMDVVRSRKGRELICATRKGFTTTLLNATDPLNAWHHEHDHDLHTAEEMNLAIGDHFIVRDTQRVPYLYRYLVDEVPNTLEATSFIEEVFEEEARFGKSGAISLIGHRIVAAVQ